MPELPEVETTRRGLLKILPGRKIIVAKVYAPKLRLPIPVDLPMKLKNNSVRDIHRRAKYMIWQMAHGPALLVHLGMSGRFRHVAAKNYAPDKHDHVALWLDDGNVLAYHDPRRFGLIDWAHDAAGAPHAWLANIGIEPLSDELNAAWLYENLQGRKVTMKAALLNQKMLNGLGNIYVSEALFLAGIRPMRLAARVTMAECKKLAPAIKKVLNASIDAGGSTLRDYRDVDGQVGFFQDRFHVYGRAGAPCKICGTKIKQLTQNGRSSYYCPQCQK
jgi:formamidopyrimidine-DNA glycosylase